MSAILAPRGLVIAAIVLAGCSSAGPTASPDESDASQRAASDADTSGKAPDAASKGASHDGSVTSRDAASDGRAHDTGTIADPVDAGEDAIAMGDDAAALDAGTDGACSVEGLAGQCMTVTACAALTGHTSTAGYCPGPASIECCTDTPSTADNPPTPPGYVLMQQSQVTPAMTTWAVAILNDPTTYPMFSTTTKVFGTLTVLARVEWHPPDFQNSVVHRGVTLYVPS
jgi:hypothetical protein